MEKLLVKRQLCLYTYFSKSIYCEKLLLSSRDSERIFQFNQVPWVEINVLAGSLLDNNCILLHRIAQLTNKETFSHPKLTKQCQQTWKNTKALWYWMKKYFKNYKWTTQWDEQEVSYTRVIFQRAPRGPAMLHLLHSHSPVFCTIKSENSIHTGTGHAHAGSALVHQKLSPWPLKKLPAKGAKLASTVSKDVLAKSMQICEAFKVTVVKYRTEGHFCY